MLRKIPFIYSVYQWGKSSKHFLKMLKKTYFCAVIEYKV